MPNIFQYHDYRLYLKDFYDEKKKEYSYFSYRYIGSKLNLDHSFIVKILMGKRHIKESLIPDIITLCHLKGNEAMYFETLVHFTKARSDSQIKLYFEKLLSLKSVDHFNLHESQFEYFSKWYYAAVRSTIEYFAFKDDFKALAAHMNPKITLKQAKESISILENLKLIEKNDEGIYFLTKNHLSTPEKWKSLIIKDFQREVIKMSSESIERDHKDLRDISTITMAIEADKLPLFKTMLKEFREAVIGQVDEMTTPNAVYQLNLQMIPLTQSSDKK